MTGSAPRGTVLSGRQAGSKGEVWRGKGLAILRDRRLADDGKRLCEVRAARDVVYRVAPQDNSVGRGRFGGGMVPDRTAPNGWRMTGSALRRGTFWSLRRF